MSDTVTKVERLSVPRFQAAIRERAYAFQGGRADATYWRYSQGILPNVLKRLMQHPELLEALAADARALHDTTAAS